MNNVYCHLWNEQALFGSDLSPNDAIHKYIPNQFHTSTNRNANKDTLEAARESYIFSHCKCPYSPEMPHSKFV